MLTGTNSDVWGPHRISRTRMSAFITANGGSLSFTGNHVPCLFCHDDAAGSREDMVGARHHFDGTKGTNMHYRDDGTAYMLSNDASTPATTAATPSSA